MTESIATLVARARNGDSRAVARLISMVESNHRALPELAGALAPHTGHAEVIGLTGAPGVGKSTTTAELVRALRADGERPSPSPSLPPRGSLTPRTRPRVGVLAIDPSSPFTGGAILGDRIRMQDHATDPGVYIRSMSSRGHLGGLAAATPQAVRVLDGAGCDVILIETVGVGQAEVEVASLADTTLVLLAPGLGDAVQAAKAGILEIADVFVVNKADRDGANATYHDIQGMIGLAERAPGQWRPPVVKAVASRGEGIDEILAAIAKHREWLRDHDELRQRRQRRAAAEIEAIVYAALRERVAPAALRQAAGGAQDPYAAAEAILSQLSQLGQLSQLSQLGQRPFDPPPPSL